MNKIPNIRALSRKIYLTLPPPTEEDCRTDEERILQAIGDGEEPVHMPLSIYRKLYPLCPQADWKVTVTLAFTGAIWEITELEPGDRSGEHYGICADLGSTTLVAELVDLGTGEVLGRESAYNHQIAYGEDILTRIFYCKDQPERLEEIRLATVATFGEVLAALEGQTGVRASQCAAMVVAGNTTMIHFLLGLDAFCVFSSPYATRTLRPGFQKGSDLGIPVNGYVYCYPGRANYLGGDIISGMIATGIWEREDISVFLDIGTNGELVVGNKDFLAAGAGAAGPALEGGVVRTGMRALAGAVDHVSIQDGEIRCTTIGGATPEGICGSGIVDLLAQLFLNGWIDLRGKFLPEQSGKISLQGEEYAVEYSPNLWFYQSDLEEFIRTKAAANTMVEYMLDKIGLSMEDVASFYVAGAFGAHLDKEAAVTIGLYPDIDRERIVNAGNSSLEGARALLLCRDHLSHIEEILGKMDYFQFGEVDTFIQLMGAALAIPHTDLERYPTVEAELERRGRR